MHTIKPKDARPHLGIEFEHYMPGIMSGDGAAAIHEEMPQKIRPMVDYFYEVLNYHPFTERGYEAKLCTPQDEYIPHLTTLIEFLHDRGAMIRPPDGQLRFGLHVHIDCRFKNSHNIRDILNKSRNNLSKYIDPKRKSEYYAPDFYDRGFKTIEVRMMDSNFDLKNRIIPFINEIIDITSKVPSNQLSSVENPMIQGYLGALQICSI